MPNTVRVLFPPYVSRLLLPALTKLALPATSRQPQTPGQWGPRMGVLGCLKVSACVGWRCKFCRKSLTGFTRQLRMLNKSPGSDRAPKPEDCGSRSVEALGNRAVDGETGNAEWRHARAGDQAVLHEGKYLQLVHTSSSGSIFGKAEKPLGQFSRRLRFLAETQRLSLAVVPICPKSLRIGLRIGFPTLRRVSGCGHKEGPQSERRL